MPQSQAYARPAEETVDYRLENGIAWVWFNRPEKRNSMSPRLNRQMLRVLEALEFRDDVQVLILSGEGVAWSSGMDVMEYFCASEAEGIASTRKAQREANRWWERLRWYEKPTIAMVNGWCFGDAYSILFACDIAIASDEAHFALSAINLAMLPGGAAAKAAAELMPYRKAMYHAMTGECLSGKEAAEWGIVTESVPADQLEERVRTVADVLKNKEAGVLRATKWAMRRVKEMTSDSAEDYLIRAQEALNDFIRPERRRELIEKFLNGKAFKPGLGPLQESDGCVAAARQRRSRRRTGQAE